jgi:hypothetical protein
LTLSQTVSEIGAVLGREIAVAEVSPEDARSAMIGRGFPFPEELIDRLHALLVKTIHRPALVTRDIEIILGRPALSYTAWVADHIEAFRRVTRS